MRALGSGGGPRGGGFARTSGPGIPAPSRRGVSGKRRAGRRAGRRGVPGWGRAVVGCDGVAVCAPCPALDRLWRHAAPPAHGSLARPRGMPSGARGVNRCAAKSGRESGAREAGRDRIVDMICHRSQTSCSAMICHSIAAVQAQAPHLRFTRHHAVSAVLDARTDCWTTRNQRVLCSSYIHR